MLKLLITKYEDKPQEELDAEMRSYEDRNRNSYRNQMEDPMYPRKDRAVGVMEIMITNEQFEAIRKAVLTNF